MIAESAERASESAPTGERYVRTELLERIAHELRGPAGVTLGALDEIERALSSAETDQARALLSMVRRGARRVLRTAERLTRTAQLEAGGVHMTTASTDVRDLIARCVRDAEQIEGRSAIQVELVMPGQPCQAQIDASWLGTALSELFSQAIRCARRTVQIHVTSDDRWVRISVVDDRPTLFEVPVQRFIPVRDRRDCALGWPLVIEVAQAHGGSVSIEPLPSGEPGRGGGAKAVLSLQAG